MRHLITSLALAVAAATVVAAAPSEPTIPVVSEGTVTIEVDGTSGVATFQLPETRILAPPMDTTIDGAPTIEIDVPDGSVGSFVLNADDQRFEDNNFTAFVKGQRGWANQVDARSHRIPNPSDDATYGPAVDERSWVLEPGSYTLSLVAENNAPSITLRFQDTAGQLVPGTRTLGTRATAGSVTVSVPSWNQVNDDVARFDFTQSLELPGSALISSFGEAALDGSYNYAKCTSEVAPPLSVGPACTALGDSGTQISAHGGGGTFCCEYVVFEKGYERLQPTPFHVLFSLDVIGPVEQADHAVIVHTLVGA